MAGLSECLPLKGFVHFWTLTIEPTAYEDYEGSIFGQLEKILKDAHEPHRIESKESEDDLSLQFEILN